MRVSQVYVSGLVGNVSAKPKDGFIPVSDLKIGDSILVKVIVNPGEEETVVVAVIESEQTPKSSDVSRYFKFKGLETEYFTNIVKKGFIRVEHGK